MRDRQAKSLWCVIVLVSALPACGSDPVQAGGGTDSETDAASTGSPPGGSFDNGDAGPSSADGLDETGPIDPSDPSDTGHDETGDETGDPNDCRHEGPPVIDADLLPDCDPICDGAHCVPGALIPEDLQSQLAPCGNGGFCTPDNFIETGGDLLLATCTSAAGAEGRCVSACLPAVIAQIALLPVDVCEDGERCVPCFDPLSGEETGACSISCDTGPTEPPVELTCPWDGPPIIDVQTLPECEPACGGAHCMPAAFVPEAQQALLTPCRDGFCTPDPLIETAGNVMPVVCSPFPGVDAEGRCQSICLPDVAAQSDMLQQDVCGDDERCVPCYDPFTASETGACSSSSCDAPVDPPFVFPSCCPNSMGVDEGTCVTAELIPPDDQGSLNQLTCADEMLCVPNEYLPTPTAPVSTCTAAFGASGTCVSECVDIPSSWLFSQADCPDNHLCVACWLAGDPPPPGC